MTKLSFAAFAGALLSLIPVASFGDDGSSYCTSLPKLSSMVKDCQQNVFFVKAARNCTDRLEQQIQTQQSLLAAAMAVNQANAASAQSGRMANSAQNLSQMQATLTNLENQATAARAEIVAYSENFTYAGPIGHEMAQSLGIEKYLKGFGCFADNQDLLKIEVKAMNRDIASLDKARLGAAQLAATTKASQQSLTGSMSNNMVHGRAPASAGASVPQGQSIQPASSITGTNKASANDHASQQQLNQ